MTEHLRALGYKVNRKRVSRLMKTMGFTIYRKQNTSQPNKGHKVYPYLLKGLQINRPNQVWATDITYVPMQKGFMYLMAIVDLYSRKVLFGQSAIRWNRSGVPLCYKKPLTCMENLKYSTQTKERNLPLKSLLRSYSINKFKFLWMVGKSY